MDGELCGLGEQAVVRMAGSGAGASHRVVTPAKGWAGGFVAACSVLLVWAEPHGVRAVLRHMVSVGTCVQVSPGFEKGMGSLWRAAVAAELDGHASPLQ